MTFDPVRMVCLGDACERPPIDSSRHDVGISAAMARVLAGCWPCVSRARVRC